MLNRDKDKFDSGFESFRKERNKRRLSSGQAFRPAAQHSQVLQELEAREAQEAQNQQLTREVADFFADATRTAANIVAKVSASEEVRQEEGVSGEMADFLRDAIRRAQDLISIIQSTATGEEGRTELSADVHNLLGQKLDAFRNEGTAQLEDKHIGQDPFAIELDLIHSGSAAETDDGAGETSDYEQDDTSAQDEHAEHSDPEIDGDSASGVEEIEDHLVAEVVAEEGQAACATVPQSAVEASGPQAAFSSADLFARLAVEDVGRLKECLKLLVRSAMMTKSEALEVFRNVVPK